ncbi:MAG: dihydrofolate reductase family protein [bacterium]
MGGPWTYESGHSFNATGTDRAVLDELFSAVCAGIVGRRMYDVVDGWGEEQALPFPIFVVTSRPADKRVVGKSSYTVVTDGIQSALRQARAAAGDKGVSIGGGARVIQRYLAAGVVDDMQVHLAPVLLGKGTRLFDDLGSPPPRITPIDVRWSEDATHVRYQVG